MYQGQARFDRSLTSVGLQNNNAFRHRDSLKPVNLSTTPPENFFGSGKRVRQRFLSPDAPVSGPIPAEAHYSPPPIAHHSPKKQTDSTTVDSKEVHIRKRVGEFTYSTADLIGEGYTSRVYRATRDRSSEMVAIKVVELKKYSASNREMLQSQVNILKTLNHPNVIHCHDVIMSTHNCYIVTELCEGGDLLSLLKKTIKAGLKISDNQMAAIMRDILNAFRYLAEQGVVHRDIKPANIFFKKGTAKIADFGFAKKLSLLKAKESYNVGTPLYMPPEALTDSQYSLKSDIFSIGVIFFEMVFGQFPWECKSESELISRLMREPLKFPTQVSPALTALLQGCLAVDDQIRFTVDQLFACEYVQTLLSNPEDVDTVGFRNCIDSFRNELIKPQSALSLRAARSPPRAPAGGDYKLQMQRNTAIVMVQLNFCRFMYYLLKNRVPLMQKKSKDKLNTVLQLHLLRLIGKIAKLATANAFKLSDYQEFKICVSFLKIYPYLRDYQTRYKSELQNREGTFDSEQLRVLKQLDADGRDQQFYEQAMAIVRPLCKELLVALDGECTNASRLQGSLISSIEGLRSIFKYLSLLKMMVKHFEDFEYFMMFSSITVLPDYSKSTAGSEQLLKLKQQLIG